MRYISLFSGIEAASVAWDGLQMEPVAFCEIDAFPSAVLARRFPGIPNLGDITKVEWEEVLEEHGAIDLIVGGSPCQSFSIAGGRESLDGESRLMFEYIRAVRDVRPRWFLWENVPGVLSTRDGAFEQLLTEMEKLGYGMAWRTLDAQFFGVAQRRRRVFLVGCLGGGGASAAVLFERESVSGNTKPSREKREELARAAERRARSGGFKFHQGAAAGGVGYRPEQSPTLTADYHNPAVCLQTDHIGQNGRNHSVEICKTLDVASAVPVVCMADTQGGAAIGEWVAPTMTAHASKDAPVLAIDCRNSAAHGELSGTLQAKKDGGYSLNYQNPIAIPVKSDTTIKGGKPGDPAYTLRRGGEGGANDIVAAIDDDGYIVRRLTPRECERLQGFPDDWTLIPYRGKPAEQCPDSPRYKALGNSMAVPVMKWIGERILAVDKLEASNG